MVKNNNLFLANVFCVLLLLICVHGKAQDTWVSYSHKIETKGYEGNRFRLHALIRAEVIDDSAAARLWVRVHTENGIGFFDNMMQRPVRSLEWKKYLIEGKIDSGGIHIAFGAFVLYNGKFYFDDLKLDIETNDGKWTNVFTADFEDGKNSLREAGASGDSGSINKYYKDEIVKGGNGQGAQSLLIEGINVPTYGVNKNAGKFAEVNGIKLYYEVYGEGPPLVVLHGNGGSIENASPMYPDLVKKYKVIAVDNRAHGKSGDTDAPLTYEQMASDVNALLEQLKIDSVLIWGQSDGAILGLILAIDYPKKVKKVLAFGSNIQPDSSAIFPWAIAAVEKIAKESADPREKKLNKLMAEHPNIPYSKLSLIKAPVLIMAGDRDVIRPEHSIKLFQSIPNSQLCIIPGATHAASWEKKKYFLMILDDFFNKPFEMPDTKDWL